MKKHLLLIILLFAVMSVAGQQKIGYANLEFILRNMPEAELMNKEITTYTKALEEQIAAKQEYYQSLLQDFVKKQEEGFSETLLNTQREQIISLEQEIQIDINNADAKIAALSNERLAPITQKIIDAVNKVYEEEGYTYIFNSADGTGNSIVLKGPENANLTYRILKELGVDIEEEEE
jgi:outer membrane protein